MDISLTFLIYFSKGQSVETCLNTEDSPPEFIWTNATDTVWDVYVLALSISAIALSGT